MTVAVQFDDFGYQLSCGLPIPEGSMFRLDPLIKEESLRYRQGGGSVLLLERANSTAWLRDAEGARVTYPIRYACTRSRARPRSAATPTPSRMGKRRRPNPIPRMKRPERTPA
jgi:hypothetical protein